MIVTAVFTCGRRDYLERTLASYREQVTGPTRTVIFDDAGDAAFTDWLYTLPDVSVASWGRNRGFTRSINLAWMWLVRHAVEPWVFHLEEDFTFDRPVDLTDLVEVLAGDETLDQIALLRHPFFPREHRAGSIIAEHPDAYTDAGTHLAHQLVFTTNPSVYRRDLCHAGWPQQSSSEKAFTRARVADGRHFAYWGQGEPWVTHIGDQRHGVGGY